MGTIIASTVTALRNATQRGGAFSRMRGEIPTVVDCPCCGEQATINRRVDQDLVMDYFYECRCGCTIEPDEIDPQREVPTIIDCPHCGEQAIARFFTDGAEITDWYYDCVYCDRITEPHRAEPPEKFFTKGGCGCE